MAKKQTQPVLAEDIKPALRAIYEAAFRLSTIMNEIPINVSSDGEDDASFSYLPKILKEHGVDCLSVIYNALEMINNAGINIEAYSSEDGNGDLFEEAFFCLKKGRCLQL